MNEKKKAPRGKFLFLYLIMVLILLTMMVTATYTWFSISRTPRVSDIGLYINAPVGLVISKAPEGEPWVNQLDFRELVSETAPLRPVTWSEKEQRFYAAQYGADGRQTGQWIPLSDEINANREDVFGYYIKVTFYATTDTSVKVRLTDAVEIDGGISGSGTYLIGTPLWDGDTLLHSDGGNGAQNAMRIGLKFTPVEDGQAREESSEFYIYEPNCDTHVGDEKGYVATPSIDGAESLVPEERLIRQTSTTWTEANIVEHGVVVKDMGEFISDTGLLDIKAQQMVRVDMYIWLEGQDVDCDNRIGHKAQIMANIQFFGDAGGQSGMNPIPHGSDDE